MEEKRNIDELFDEIDSIVEKIGQPDTSLEESFSLYAQGIDRIRTCNERIEQIEKQVMMLDEDGELRVFE